MSKKYQMKYTVDKSIQSWMSEDESFKKGEIVYIYSRFTYGCIGHGVAITREDGKTPFSEVPKDSIELVK